MEPVRTAVVGAGTMGMDIAEILALAGCDVVLQSRRAEARERFLATLARHYERQVKRGRLAAEAKAVELERARVTGDFEGFGDRQIVIEAVEEDASVKAQVLARLEEVSPPAALIASTTSSLAIAGIAAAASRPERVIGLHFFNPARFVRLVEVVSTPATTAAGVVEALRFLELIGRVPLRVADGVGFLVNRLLIPATLEGCRVYSEHAAAPGEIDAACVKWGMLLGPCAMLDLVGLDVGLAICRNCERTLGPRYRPPPILERCVAAGRLGRKSGQGIFAYPHGRPEPDPALDAIRSEVESEHGAPRPTRFSVERLLVPLINEAITCLAEGVATAPAIDLAMMEVVGMPRGPLAYCRQLGRNGYRALVEGLVGEFGDRFALRSDLTGSLDDESPGALAALA